MAVVPCIDEATKGTGLAHTASYLPVICEVIVPYSTVFHQWFRQHHIIKSNLHSNRKPSLAQQNKNLHVWRLRQTQAAGVILIQEQSEDCWVQVIEQNTSKYWAKLLHGRQVNKASQGFTSSSPWVLQGRQPLECLAPGHPWPLRWKESVTIGKRVERVERVEMAWLSETLCISVHLCATEDEAFSANRQSACWGEKTSDSPNLLQVLQRGSSPEPSWAHHPHLKRSARSKSARATMALWKTERNDLNRFVMQHPCPRAQAKMHLQQILWALQWVTSLSMPPSGGGCTTGLPSSFCPSSFSWANLK